MHRTQGIILSSEKFGEADQLISLFSRDFGKIKLIAQGSLKHDSKMRSLVQMGHAIDCVIVPLRSGRYRLTSPSLMETFSCIRGDARKLSAYLCSLVLLDHILHEGEQDERLWNFFLRWFSELTDGDLHNRTDVERSISWFLGHLLFFLGGLREKEKIALPATLREALAERNSAVEWSALRRAYQASLGFSLPKCFLVE